MLSIDMGIRNLAFAHLVVSSSRPSSSSPSSSSCSHSTSSTSHLDDAKRDRTGYTNTSKDKGGVYLNAWHRLPMTDASLREFSQSSSSSSSSSPPKKLEAEEEEDKEQETFTPETYAPRAYTLLTTLLARYRPTHILIERQRFRSGGASAVQEWSLRVGVFEGMLHAVLFTLGQQQLQLQQKQKQAPPVVVGVEPRRVGRYWELVRGVSTVDEGVIEVKEGEGGKKTTTKKKKKSAKEGKKVKIALVGRWLEDACSSSSSSTPDSAPLAEAVSTSASSSVTSAGRTDTASQPGSGLGTSTSTSTAAAHTTTPAYPPDDTRLSIHPHLQSTITAYLAKWRGSPRTRTKKKKTPPTPSEMADGTAGRSGDTDKDVDQGEDPDVEIERGIGVEIGKLDDLADCLVQGVTWLEWRAMRERVVGEGVPGEFRG